MTSMIAMVFMGLSSKASIMKIRKMHGIAKATRIAVSIRPNHLPMKTEGPPGGAPARISFMRIRI